MKNKITHQKENQVTRRSALFTAVKSVGALGMLFTSRTMLAQEQPVCPPPPVMVKVVESEIAKNHGHEFQMSLADLINGGGQNLSIQGDSGHPHTIAITNDQIIALMKGEVIEMASSKDASHTHAVKLVLVERQAIS